MKMKPKEKVKSKEEARQIAIDWQNWQSNISMSISEVNDWNNYFCYLGEKFDLTEEFRENAII